MTTHDIYFAQACLPSWMETMLTGSHGACSLGSSLYMHPCASMFAGVKLPEDPFKGSCAAPPGWVQIKWQPALRSHHPPHQEGKFGAASYHLFIVPHISKCHTKYISHMHYYWEDRAIMAFMLRPVFSCMDYSSTLMKWLFSTTTQFSLIPF